MKTKKSVAIYARVSTDKQKVDMQLVDLRDYVKRAGTGITSNKAFSDWAELFHDPIIVTVILDRLLHHSVVINVKGSSYRLRGKIKENKVNEVQKVNGCGSILKTQNGSILNDR